MEIFKPIHGFFGKYAVSNSGRIKSLERVIPHARFGKMIISDKIRKPVFRKNGYVQVPLHSFGKQKYKYVHRLVYEAFKGPIKKGMDINHINFNRSDNRLENLEMVDRLSNIRHSSKHGHMLNKLTFMQKEEISKSAEKAGELAKRFGVHRCHIWLIRGKQPGRK